MAGREPCAVSWCEELSDHDGLHRLYVGEIVPDVPSATSAISVTVEGYSRDDRHPVVAMGSRGYVSWARLSWDEAEALAALLVRARERLA